MKGNARQWQEILQNLKEWETDEEISGYVSNPTLQCLEEILDGEISESALDKLRNGLRGCNGNDRGRSLRSSTTASAPRPGS